VTARLTDVHQDQAAAAVVAEAERLLGEARSAGDTGRPAAAVRLCGRALKVLGPEHSTAPGLRRVKAQVLVTQAYQFSGLGDVQKAMAALEEADRADPEQRAAISGTRATCLMRLGDSSAALVAFDEAIAGIAGADARVLFTAYLNRGQLHMTAGRLPQAQADTEAAYRAALECDDRWGVHMAGHNLGYLRFLYGDLPGALAAMESAQRALDEAAPVGMPAMDRARVLLAAGLIQEAAEFGELAVQDFERNHAVSELADALMVAAETELLRGDWKCARTRARRAKALNRKRHNGNAALLAELMELKAAAGVRATSKNPQARARLDARKAAGLADALAGDLPADATSASLLAAEALLDAGELDAAEAAAAAVATTPSSPISTRLHARLVAARLRLQRDEQAQGLAQIRRGLDDLADFQARFGSQDMQAGAAIHGSQLARLGLRTAVANGSPAAVLQWLERSRAVSTRLPAVHPPADQGLADMLGELRLATIEARAAAVAGQRDAALDRRVARLRAQVRARSWTVSGTGTVLRPLTLAAVRRLLATDRSDPTVIAFLRSPAELHVLVIGADGACSLKLGSWPAVEDRIRRAAADLDLLAASRVPPPVITVARQSLTARLAELDEVLLRPILAKLTTGPVFIAAVGPMATLPWGLLPSLVGRPVSVSSSVTAAMSSVGRPSRAYLRGVLAVAGPDVPGAVEEVTAIAGMHADVGLLVGEGATGEAVLAQIPQGGLLHIAAHGHHEPDSALFSSVLLADGPLYGYDIAPNRSLPDHVVLSSCDVGRSDDRPGGEPLGLAAALLRSGVSTVIAGVSRIADEVAAATMIVYHQRLLAGDGPAVALSTAIAEARGAPAPLTCFGAGS